MKTPPSLNPATSDPGGRSGFEGPQNRKIILVWDLPTRIFHWILAILVIACFITGNTGGNAMMAHLTLGEMILALVYFRLIWGVAGSAPSRFTAFIRGPKKVWDYAKTLTLRHTSPHIGHNPLGGWSVAAMLLCLIVQTATGLFSNDDIFLEGPLAHWVTKSASDWLTRIHLANRMVMAMLAATHIAAIGFYWIHKGENLIRPMITGRMACGENAAQPAMKSTVLALFIAVLAGAGTYLLVRS